MPRWSVPAYWGRRGWTSLPWALCVCPPGLSGVFPRATQGSPGSGSYSEEAGVCPTPPGEEPGDLTEAWSSYLDHQPRALPAVPSVLGVLGTGNQTNPCVRFSHLIRAFQLHICKWGERPDACISEGARMNVYCHGYNSSPDPKHRRENRRGRRD